MKKLLIFLLSLALLAAFPARAYAADEEKEIEAKASILLCMDTGEILLENNAYDHLSPASVTKVMSILLIAEALDSGKISLDDTVTASENAVSKGGSQIWLEFGEQMRVEELLKAVIIASANDACTALGEYVAGSDEAFVAQMNERAEQLGLTNTHFENCTGLDDTATNHYSCAYDLAVMASEVMRHAVVLQYTTVWLDSLRGGETELNNTNKLVNTYNGITGLKTGTTSNAGFCLCATATRDGMSLVSVVLGANTSEDRFNLAAQLLDYGFANYQLNPLEVEAASIEPVQVKYGTVKAIQPLLPENKRVLVKKGTAAFDYEVKSKPEVEAPVQAGDILGEVLVTADGEAVASLPLTAEKAVPRIAFSYIFRLLFSKL